MRDSRLKVIRGGRTKSNRIWRRLFATAILVLTAFLIWNSMEYLSLLAAEVTVTRHKEVDFVIPVQCIVIRNEFELSSPSDGEYIPLVENYTRVRVGQVVARIDGPGGSFDVKATGAGLVTHNPDNLAGSLSMGEGLNAQTVELAVMVMEDPPESKESKYVSKGQVVASIVDNSRFQIITGQSAYFDKRQTLKITGSSGEETRFTVSPRDVLESNYTLWVLWDVPSIDILARQRVFFGELVTDRQYLVLVPEEALYTRDGELGVFVLRRNKPVFNPVNTHYSQDGLVGVTGLANGQQVLSLPKWASFAKRWWHK